MVNVPTYYPSALPSSKNSDVRYNRYSVFSFICHMLPSLYFQLSFIFLLIFQVSKFWPSVGSTSFLFILQFYSYLFLSPSQKVHYNSVPYAYEIVVRFEDLFCFISYFMYKAHCVAPIRGKNKFLTNLVVYLNP
jgi:hypothetical protein